MWIGFLNFDPCIMGLGSKTGLRQVRRRWLSRGDAGLRRGQAVAPGELPPEGQVKHDTKTPERTADVDVPASKLHFHLKRRVEDRRRPP